MRIRPQVQILLSEYSSLRDEIGRLQDHQQQIVGFGFLALAALAGAFGAAVSGSNGGSLTAAFSNYHLLLLVAPLVYLFLAVAFAERTNKILSAGHYIDSRLRPKLSELTGLDVLGWETYRRESGLISKSFARALDLGGRWFGFIAPMLLCLGLLAYVHPHLEPYDWALVGLDAVAVGAAILLAGRINEAAGVPPRK